MALPSTVLASRLLVKARLRHLQVFVRVAEMGSIQRAAVAVGLTQPSTSYVLADLEKLLGCELFWRHARGATPTRVGLSLLPYARRVLDTVQEAAEVVTAVQQAADASVRVAAISSGVSGVLAEVLSPFGQLHPRVLVQVHEWTIEQIGDALAADAVDLVVCREPDVVPTGWAFTALRADRFVVVCGPQHPLRHVSGLTVADLWSQTWLQGPTASAARRAFDQLAETHGVVPSIRLVSSRSAAILWAMLSAEPLLSLMPDSFVRQLLETGQLHKLVVDIHMPFQDIGVLYRTLEEGEAAHQMRAFLIHYFAGAAASGQA
jgi:DNA-binding transcriptional LysR family regulator